jgi:uncharacterized protein (DUF1697 family)
VIFSATSARAANTICAAVEDDLEAQHGRRIGTVLRSHDELTAIAARDPFPGAEPKLVLVVFLSKAPSAKTVADLRGLATGDEKVIAEGREIFLSLPAGMGRSKLGAGSAKPVDGLVATSRNWRTVTALARLTAPNGP